MGIGAGFGVFAVASTLLRSLLFGVSPTSPVPYAVVALGRGAAATAGAALPALRAGSVDPVPSLGVE